MGPTSKGTEGRRKVGLRKGREFAAKVEAYCCCRDEASWRKLDCCLQVRNGHIKRITDNDIQSLVIELYGTNVRFAARQVSLATRLDAVFY